MTPLLTALSDPLGIHLLDEHQKRYERIKAWRDAQRNPHFDEVCVRWRREFEQEPSEPVAL